MEKVEIMNVFFIRKLGITLVCLFVVVTSIGSNLPTWFVVVSIVVGGVNGVLAWKEYKKIQEEKSK